ncbi:uncharacterized protein LY89DRAFT_682790, partial [Mollisia scopiformis]
MQMFRISLHLNLLFRCLSILQATTIISGTGKPRREGSNKSRSPNPILRQRNLKPPQTFEKHPSIMHKFANLPKRSTFGLVRRQTSGSPFISNSVGAEDHAYISD